MDPHTDPLQFLDFDPDFSAPATALLTHARREGELRLTVPMAYVEGRADRQLQ